MMKFEIKHSDWVHSILYSKIDLWEQSLKFAELSGKKSNGYSQYLVMKDLVRKFPESILILNNLNTIGRSIDNKMHYHFLLHEVPKRSD